jgi:hypothetical protein
MKKKLKVKKAFLGMMAKSIRRGTPIRKKITNIFPRGPKASTIINPVRPPGTVPGSGAGIVKPGQINPFGPGGLPIGGYGNPVRQPGMYQPGGPPRDPNMFSTTPPRPMQSSSQINPNSPRSLPFASAVGPSMQGVGDPRLGAATIPGNQAQMQMRDPTQAAPVQPVPAMKKGGMVRGQGAAIRGTKFKGIF